MLVSVQNTAGSAKYHLNAAVVDELAVMMPEMRIHHDTAKKKPMGWEEKEKTFSGRKREKKGHLLTSGQRDHHVLHIDHLGPLH